MKNIKLNNINNVKAINVALSDKVVLSKIIYSHGSNWHRLLEDEDHDNVSQFEIVVTTGDELLQSLEKLI